MSETLLDRLASEIEQIFEPLANAAEDPFWYSRLFSQLGIDDEDPSADAILAALSALLELRDQVAAMSASPSPSFEGVAHLLKAAKDAFTAIRSLSDPGAAAAAFAGLGEDLIELLMGVHLASTYPLLYDILVLLTLIDPAEVVTPTAPVFDGDTARRAPVVFPRFRLERIIPLLRDPVTLLRAEYVNSLATVDDANAMADKLFPRLSAILTQLCVPNLYGIQEASRPLLGDAAALVDHTLHIYLQSTSDGVDEDAGISLSLASADRGDLGLVISPFGELTFTKQVAEWTLVFGLSAAVDAFAYGRQGFVVAASVETTSIDAKFSAEAAAPDGAPAFIFGSADGSRLEIGGAQIAAEATFSADALAIALAAAVSKAQIVITAGDGDGFLKRVLPANGLQAKFDLGIGWSTEGGLTFHGAAGLDATLPVGISIGGVVKIPSVHLALQIKDDALQLEVSASVAVTIGPVQAVIDRIGTLSVVTFPESGGNLGIADLSFVFKPPSGAGLEIDSAGVSGGGFLKHDDLKSEYSGVLQLEFDDLSLQAFGLITTQVPGGSGYSLLALIDADFPPVQLGWGFTLNGVGGLLGVNRTASTDALHAALKANTLSSILFPRNAITNAPQVLATLDAIFPPASGRFIFGPMALIGWGSPTLLTAAIAVIVELPEPIRIVLIARLSVRLPSESQALVRINMDALGILDLSQDSLSLDATLFDSRLLTFTLSGDMALRANWSSSQREFLLAIGGFHPQFVPPADFPALKRITIDMPSGSVSKLRLAAYLAVSANTVQFGATLDVFIGVSGFGLSGHLGFDALLQLAPFHFAADISGHVALTAGGDDLMSVGLDATLSGPAPWNIAGDFKIHIVFFDVHISFSFSWGEDAPAPQIAPVEVLPLLTAALADPRNWGAGLPPGTSALVSLRSSDSNASFVHPLSRLEVHQSVVPLGLTITRFGSAPATGVALFTITDYQVNGSTAPHEAIQDDFAPAQFFELSDDEKLARPSFERHDAGARLTGSLVASGPPISKTISYETLYVDQPGGALRTDKATPPRTFNFGDLSFILATGASARAAIRTAGNRRYTAPGTPVRIAPRSFVIADRSSLAPAGLGTAGGMTYSAARAALNAAVAQSPAAGVALQIVSTHEITTT